MGLAAGRNVLGEASVAASACYLLQGPVLVQYGRHLQQEKAVSIARQATEIYESDYRERLEASHFGQFVAIEPESRESFVAPTFIDAALAAKAAHPTKKSFVIRIGYDAAIHIGAASK